MSPFTNSTIIMITIFSIHDVERKREPFLDPRIAEHCERLNPSNPIESCRWIVEHSSGNPNEANFHFIFILLTYPGYSCDSRIRCLSTYRLLDSFKFTQVTTIDHWKRIWSHMGIHFLIRVHIYFSRSVHLGAPWSTLDHLGPLWATLGYLGEPWST
jgi:hypothetical protein